MYIKSYYMCWFLNCGIVHEIHPFKVYNQVAFSIFSLLCFITTLLISEHLIIPQRNPQPLARQSLFLLPSSPPQQLIYFFPLWICPLKYFMYMKSQNIWPFVSAFFTWQNAFQGPSILSMYQYIIPFYDAIIFCGWIYYILFSTSSQLMDIWVNLLFDSSK